MIVPVHPVPEPSPDGRWREQKADGAFGLMAAPTSSGEAVRGAILVTLIYADLFDYALTDDEIHRYLIGQAASPADVTAMLNRDGELRDQIAQTGDRFHLRSRRLFADIRRARVAASAELWPRRPQIADRLPFNHADVLYYQPSEYLPPLDTGGARVYLPQKSAPEYAPQAIISVPPEPDNRTQTIVTPPNLKLHHDVPLPNIVAWSQTQVAVPLAATVHSAADVKMSALAISVVAPPPQVKAASLVHTLQAPQSAIIEPPPRKGGVASNSSSRPQSTPIPVGPSIL